MLMAHFGIISALGSTAPTRAAPTLGMCWDHGIKRRGTSFHLVSRLLDLFPEWVICDGKLRKLLSGMPQAKPKLLSGISAGAGLTKDSALRILQAQEAKGSDARKPVVCVERVVSEVVREPTVKLVGSRTGYDLDLAAKGATELGRVG